MAIGGIGIAGAAMGGAGLLGSLLNRPRYNTPDISGELKNIAQMFEQMRAQGEVSVNRQAAQGRSAAANNMAVRGTYTSPVAEKAFGALEGERLNALGTMNAQLAGQEAGIRANLLSQLLGMNQQQQQLKNQANAQIWGGLTGMGSNLLLASLLNPAAGAPRTGTVMPGGQAGGWMPYYG